MEKVLITGATGFIGRHLLECLDQRARDTFDLIPWSRESMGDLLVPDDRIRTLDAVAPHAVLHLAWCSTSDDDYPNNPQNLAWGASSASFLQESVQRGIRFLAAGSAADQPGDKRFDSPYSRSKQLLRRVFDAYRSTDLVTWLRPHYVISIADQRPRVVREYFRQIHSGHLRIEDPTADLDFIHVVDVVEGISLAIEARLRGVIELGSGYLHSVSDLLAAIDDVRMGAPGASTRRTPPTSPSTCSRDLLEQGWRPTHTHELFGDVI